MHQLILVRHAETQANTENRWQGQRHDGILTPQGRRQIERVARRLEAEREEIVALYTSPLGRALQTAQSIGAAIDQEPRIDPDLQEMDFGELDSLTWDEIVEQHPDFYAAWQKRDDIELAWPGGERRRDFRARVIGSLDRILARHTEERVVVVAHGGSLRVGIAHLLAWGSVAYDSFNLHNCGLTRLVFEFGRWRLLTLNDTCHLDGIG